MQIKLNLIAKIIKIQFNNVIYNFYLIITTITLRCYLRDINLSVST